MNNGYRSLVELLLVVVLVFDRVLVDKVAQVRARIPTHVVRIHIHFAQLLDHLDLVGSVGLGTRGSGSEVRRSVLIVVMAVRRGDLDGRKRKGVCHLQGGYDVHADEKAGRNGGESLRAVFHDFHHHLGFS